MKNIFYFIILCLINLSCNKADDLNDYHIQKFDRNIRFKIIGNYSGRLNCFYANPNNNLDANFYETIHLIPWEKM